MKANPDYEKDIATIRSMMERSSKFLSLSGMSGILAGVYALIGAAIAYSMLADPAAPLQYRVDAAARPDLRIRLIMLATVVLALSITTAVLFSKRKARKHGQQLWNPTSRLILINFLVPLVAGGLFIITMLFTGHAALAAPACLLFYGLGLVNASANTFNEIRYLGFCQIALGLISAAMPDYGLVCWAIGFGALHIFYGAVMHKKYDQ